MTDVADQNKPATERVDNPGDQADFELIKKEIVELGDGTTDNDKLEIDGKLTVEFLNSLSESQINDLLESINNVEKNLNGASLPDEIKDLKVFLVPLVNKYGKLNGNINGITALKEGEKTVGKTVGNIESKLNDILSGIDEKLKLIEGIADDRLVNAKKLLEITRDVINNPTKENTNILQKYIYDNIVDNDRKQEFEKKNHKKADGNFDGSFGPNTLQWVNEYLDGFYKYVDEVKVAKETEQKLKNADEEQEMTLEKIIDDLSLKKEDNLDRSGLGLPEQGDIYSKDGENGYYLVEGEYLVFLPKLSDGKIDSNGKKIKISEYKKGSDKTTWEEYKLNVSGNGDASGGNNPDNAGSETGNGNPETTDQTGETTPAQEIIDASGLVRAGGIKNSDLGLDNSTNIYMASGDTRYLYYIRSDQKIVRVSYDNYMKGNYFDGNNVLDMSKYRKGERIDKNEQIWSRESLNSYPPVNEKGRKFLENLLKDSVRGADRLKNAKCEVIISKDSNGMDKYKVRSFGKQWIIAKNTFSKGWLFEGQDHLRKDLKMIDLVNYIVSEYRGKMDGAQFVLKDGEKLVISKNGKEKTVIGKSEWKRDYGTIDDSKIFGFCNYLNKQCGTIYEEVQTPITTEQSNAPAAQPNAPAAQPNAPAAQSNAPAAQPNAPAAQSNAPAAQSNAPAAQPNAPAAQPNAPAAQPNAPAAQPNAPAAQPNAPAAQPAGGSVEQSEAPKLPEAISNPDSIQNTLLISDFKNQKCKTFFVNSFNELIKKQGLTKDEIGYLELLRSGLVDGNRSDVSKLQSVLNVSPARGDLGIMTFTNFFEKFNVAHDYPTINREWRDILNTINQNKIEGREQEATSYVKELEQNLHYNQDKIDFRNKVSDTVNSYKNSSKYSLSDFKNDVTQIYNEMPKHYERTGEGNTTYKFEGKKLNANGKPLGEGIVMMTAPGNNTAKYDVEYNGNGDVTKCKKGSESINIYYKGNKPYFSIDGKELSIKADAKKDICRVAGAINAITSVVRNVYEKNKRGLKKINISPTGHLIAWFEMHGVRGVVSATKAGGEDDIRLNLKNDVKSSLYIDNMSNSEVEDWFLTYLKTKTSQTGGSR